MMFTLPLPGRGGGSIVVAGCNVLQPCTSAVRPRGCLGRTGGGIGGETSPTVWGRTGGGSHGAHGEPLLGAAQGLVWAVAGRIRGGAVSGRVAGRLREVRRRGQVRRRGWWPGGAREAPGREAARKGPGTGGRRGTWGEQVVYLDRFGLGRQGQGMWIWAVKNGIFRIYENGISRSNTGNTETIGIQGKPFSTRFRI